MNEFKDDIIWIIGASYGIGEALARELHHQKAKLILSARSLDKLEALNTELDNAHHVTKIDLADRDNIEQVSQSLIKKYNIKRIICLAAIYRPRHINETDLSYTEKIVQVNLTGSLLLTYALLPWMLAQCNVQLALCASVAGYTGLPGGQPYSSTKAAIINFCESLHAEIGDRVDIKVINPGFVRTRMTDKNDFPMPLRIEPSLAAKQILKGLSSKAFEIHFPKAFSFSAKLLNILPYCLKLPITRMMRRKNK